jgi:DNA replication and repair protein RecF
VRLDRLWLSGFRIYRQAELAPGPGVTVIVGGNGQGKTSLLEAVAYLATLGSFRAVPPEALVHAGSDRAVVRGEAQASGRPVLLETELSASGRGRALVNRQPLRRARDLLGVLRVTVFSPDDLVLVKGAPAERRRYLDELLVALRPTNAALVSDLERILRQRNALLRQAGGQPTASVTSTLRVWDAQLAEVGEALGAARQELVDELEPALAEAHGQLSGAGPVEARYETRWRDGGLAAALAASRMEDLRRAVTSVGPHRDELALSLAGLPARTHASQGEQRSVAVALRLAGHTLVTARTGEAPILLLDDVFSELDPVRSRALLKRLPEGQSLLTTTGVVPEGAEPDLVVTVEGGELHASPPPS